MRTVYYRVHYYEMDCEDDLIVATLPEHVDRKEVSNELIKRMLAYTSEDDEEAFDWLIEMLNEVIVFQFDGNWDWVGTDATLSLGYIYPASE